MGRPKTALVLDAEQRKQLETFANSRSLLAGLVRRAKIILLSASGKTNRELLVNWRRARSPEACGDVDFDNPVSTAICRMLQCVPSLGFVFNVLRTSCATRRL